LVTDAARAGSAYEVTGPQLLTIGDMVATLAQVLDRPIRYVDVPEDTAREWMATSAMAPQLATALAETMTALRANRFASIADTLQRLAGRPGQTFAEWCRENVNAFQPSPGSESIS